jgi:hypothetical protein
VTLLAALAGAASAAPCGGRDADPSFWRAIKDGGFAVPAGRRADDLADSLLGCLGSPDPEWRDRIAYEILTAWLRGGRVSAPAMKRMARSLEANLAAGLGEASGDRVYLRSFSALILSELVRQDSRERYLDDAEYARLLAAGLAYLPGERDLRGYDPEHGFVHGVAHGSDLLWRLAWSRRTDPDGLRRILAAVGTKVAPAGEHAYVHGESDRLARVVAYAVARDTLDVSAIGAWVESVAQPAPMTSWDEAFASTAGLARLHNTKQFLRALRDQLTIGESPKGADVLLPILHAGLTTLNRF